MQRAGLHLACDEREPARRILTDIAQDVTGAGHEADGTGPLRKGAIATGCLDQLTIRLEIDAVVLNAAGISKTVLFQDPGTARELAAILPHRMIATCQKSGGMDPACLNMGPETPALYRAALDDPVLHPLSPSGAQPLEIDRTRSRIWLSRATPASVSDFMHRHRIVPRHNASERRISVLKERQESGRPLTGLFDVIDWGLRMVLVLATRQERFREGPIPHDPPETLLMDKALFYSRPARRDSYR